MGFLSPWFLLGALALGLPLWLHLLRQYKRTPQPFSSLMFFERREQSSVKHRRLRYLVLLALRLALLLLLVLAFANPFINRKSLTTSRRTLNVIAVDRSFSMRSSNTMQSAKEQALRLLNALPAESLTQIAAVDAHVESLTPIGTPGASPQAAIRSLEPNDRASSFGEFTRAIRALQQTSGMHLNVEFISDMQRTSMPADFRTLAVGPDVTLHLHQASSGEKPNWAIENVDSPSAVESATSARVTATVAGWHTPAATKTVTLLLDGKEIARKSVAVPANGHASAEFSDFQVPYGFHHALVQIDSADDLPQDDNFPFSLERQDARKVLFLYARTRTGNASLYYKTALESGSHSNLTVQQQPVDQAEPQDFSHFAFIVLSDVGELKPGLSDALCAYVIKGGSVFIAIGPNTASSGTIPLSKEQFNEQRQKQSAGYVDKGYPAFNGASQFENVQFSETAAFTPKVNARLIARFADGSPLLVEEHAGEGRKLVFASTLDNTTNDFALHASFVPFVVQTARYLAGQDDNPSSLVVGTPVELRRKNEAGSADVVGPDGKHQLELAEAAKAPSFDLARTGFYEVTRADGRRLLLAAHADRRESNLQPISRETLELWRNTGETGERPVTTVSQTQTRPWGVWRYILTVALLAALLESIFAGRYFADRQLKGERQTE